jgi:hypothetical protein
MLGVGMSLLVLSNSVNAQQAPPPATAPMPQPYPGQPVYGPSPYGAPPYAPPPYGAPPQYYPPPSTAYGWQPLPPRLPYREGESHPGYHVEENPRKGFVISGAVVFVVPYFISLSVGLASTSDSDKWLMIPVFGPLGTLSSRSNKCSGDLDCALDPVVRIYLALDFATQSAGVFLFTLGYLLPKKEFVLGEYPSASGFKLKSWALAPRVFEGTKPGLVLSGEMF